MPLMTKMGWNPDAPTAELRTSLLAYLRMRQQQLRQQQLGHFSGMTTAEEIGALRRWIAWLDGQEVSV